MRKKKTFLSTSRTYLGLIFNSLSRIKKELSNIPEKELEVTLKTNDKESLGKESLGIPVETSAETKESSCVVHYYGSKDFIHLNRNIQECHKCGGNL